MTPESTATDERIEALLTRARERLLVKRVRDSGSGRLIEDLAQALADTWNADLTTCGTRHLSAERALRVVERFGWPSGVGMIEWLAEMADNAGNTFNRNAVEGPSPDDDVPF